MQRTAVGRVTTGRDRALLFRHDTISFRPPVTEKPPGKTFFAQGIQIEGGVQDFLGISSGRCYEFTGCIGNKGRTVESKRRGLAAIFFTGRYGFGTNPVAAATGTRFAAACPCMTRRQCPLLSTFRIGSLPIAVG